MHVQLYKPHPQRAQSNVRKSTQSTPMIIPFVTSLPMNQPLNSNAPHSGYSPTISFFQCYHSCSSAGTSCPSTDAYCIITSAYRTTKHQHLTPTPHTPTPPPPIPHLGDPTPAPSSGGKKGKKLNFQ